MRFDTYIPSSALRPYIRQLAIAENRDEKEYKVLPTTGLVIGFQYKGRLSTLANDTEVKLATAGITGMKDQYSVFKNIAGTGTVLVYFTETGFAHFSTHPANELFNQSLSLDNVFTKNKITETEEKLAEAATDQQRIRIIEKLLLSQLKELKTDQLIIEAVKMIYASKGSIRIKELIEKLFTSPSPFEKRFRKLVGTTPKKFASIVRFNTVLDELGTHKSLTDICYEHGFFDQAHFIKDFKQFTGETPEQYKRFL